MSNNQTGLTLRWVRKSGINDSEMTAFGRWNLRLFNLEPALYFSQESIGLALTTSLDFLRKSRGTATARILLEWSYALCLFDIMCMRTYNPGKFNIPHRELVTRFRPGQIPTPEVSHSLWNNVGEMLDYCQEIIVISYDFSGLKFVALTSDSTKDQSQTCASSKERPC